MEEEIIVWDTGRYKVNNVITIMGKSYLILDIENMGEALKLFVKGLI